MFPVSSVGRFRNYGSYNIVSLAGALGSFTKEKHTTIATYCLDTETCIIRTEFQTSLMYNILPDLIISRETYPPHLNQVYSTDHHLFPYICVIQGKR